MVATDVKINNLPILGVMLLVEYCPIMFKYGCKILISKMITKAKISYISYKYKNNNNSQRRLIR